MSPCGPAGLGAVFLRPLRCLVHWGVAWLAFMPPARPAHRDAEIPIARLRSPGAEYAVIFFHGNAEETEAPSFFGSLYPPVAVYAPEYPGYGSHPDPVPSEEGVYASARAALRRALDDGFPPSRIIFWGLSLGGGPAAFLAAQPSPVAAEDWAGVVMDSTFASILTVGVPGAWRVAAPLGIDMFPNVEHLRASRCRVAFLHSPNDEVISMMRHLPVNVEAATPRARVWVREGGHNALPVPQTMQTMYDFIRGE